MKSCELLDECVWEPDVFIDVQGLWEQAEQKS